MFYHNMLNVNSLLIIRGAAVVMTPAPLLLMLNVFINVEC